MYDPTGINFNYRDGRHDIAAVTVAAPAEAVETTAAAWASPVLLNSLIDALAEPQIGS